MMIVDSHVHIALHTYEPVEMLQTQMQYNNVEKTVLVQSSSTTDNSYLIECQRRFPSRLAVVCRVEVPTGPAQRRVSSTAGRINERSARTAPS